MSSTRPTSQAHITPSPAGPTPAITAPLIASLNLPHQVITWHAQEDAILEPSPTTQMTMVISHPSLAPPPQPESAQHTYCPRRFLKLYVGPAELLRVIHQPHVTGAAGAAAGAADGNDGAAYLIPDSSTSGDHLAGTRGCHPGVDADDNGDRPPHPSAVASAGQSLLSARITRRGAYQFRS